MCQLKSTVIRENNRFKTKSLHKQNIAEVTADFPSVAFQ